jgi:hypothetical protein
MTAMVSPSRQQQVSPLSIKKHYKKFGGYKGMAFMEPVWCTPR